VSGMDFSVVWAYTPHCRQPLLWVLNPATSHEAGNEDVASLEQILSILLALP